MEVKGLSKSSMLIRLKSSSLVLVVIGSMLMHICNLFHEKLASNEQKSAIKQLITYRKVMARYRKVLWLNCTS